MTVLDGDGGSGKGTTAAYWAALATHDGVVLLIDAEKHRDEWYERIEYMGGDLRNVIHFEHPGGVVDFDTIHVGSVDLVLTIVDSASYFTDDEGEMWSPSVATQMQTHLASLGCPSLVLAHHSKGGGDKSYGSVFWHNAPRARYTLEDHVLRCQKATGLMGVDKGFEWVVEGGETEGGVGYVDGIKRAIAEKPTKEEVQKEWLGEGRTLEEVMEYMGVKERTAKRWLGRYAENVSPAGSRGRYVLKGG